MITPKEFGTFWEQALYTVLGLALEPTIMVALVGTILLIRYLLAG